MKYAYILDGGRFVGICRKGNLDKIKEENKDRSNMYDDCVEVDSFAGNMHTMYSIWYIRPKTSAPCDVIRNEDGTIKSVMVFE